MFPRAVRQSPEIAFCLANMTPPDACNTVNSQTDLLTRVDGLVVLAPGWKRCAQCLPMADEGRHIPLLELTRPGQVLTFNHSARQLASG